MTVKPLPVVTSRDCGGFKRRLLLLLHHHPLLRQAEDTCGATGQSAFRTERQETKQKRKGRGKVLMVDML